MPFPLHKAPRGLLEIFRLRTLGAQPNLFAELVQPVTDVTDFYGVDTLVEVNENSVAPGTIIDGLTSVPAEFARRLIAVSGAVVIGANAGTFVDLSLGINLPGFVFAPVRIAEKFVNPTAVGGGYTVTATFPPLMLPAGHTLTVACSGDATGNDHVFNIRYLFQRLDGTA